MFRKIFDSFDDWSAEHEGSLEWVTNLNTGFENNDYFGKDCIDQERFRFLISGSPDNFPDYLHKLGKYLWEQIQELSVFQPYAVILVCWQKHFQLL